MLHLGDWISCSAAAGLRVKIALVRDGCGWASRGAAAISRDVRGVTHLGLARVVAEDGRALLGGCGAAGRARGDGAAEPGRRCRTGRYRGGTDGGGIVLATVP